MQELIPTPLFVFEMANNHMGDVEHGIRIIREFRKIAHGRDFHFSFKLQHRDTSYIHPDHRHRKDHKYIKRFTETKLSRDDFARLKDEITANGFISMCTPWDEPSVDLMEELGFEILKIASCSFTDWPLLERVVKSNMSIVASTAGATLDDIDHVVAFFSHRNKSFAIMHCVGEYPCLRDHLELNQIELFRNRYPDIPIGFSTHEEPENFDSIRIAVAKGASIFEKHIGVPTARYALNTYSATPEQARKWLDAATDAFTICGVSGRRKEITAKEIEDIQPLFRGAYASRDIQKGERIRQNDIFLAMPNVPGQVVATRLSKYNEFMAARDIQKGTPIMEDAVRVMELRKQVNLILDRLKVILNESRVVLPPYVDIEISNHYGIEKFDERGAILIKVINRAYSKMLVVMFAGQSYPRHRHIQKDESYHLLYGDLQVEVDGKEQILKGGDLLSINRSVPHSFKTKGGAVIEEIATTYLKGDSVYEDDAINQNSNRKILLTFWPEWLED
ncbi:MAG: N-acetylneuraminate synthase family protein [Planctomycetes bacterium]|nr:N-acetylneuraminate synthase family protein [Planctomycetota bacterium]